MIYRVSIRDTELSEDIKATSELEAKMKFCEGRSLMFRVYANKLEAEAQKKGKKK